MSILLRNSPRWEEKRSAWETEVGESLPFLVYRSGTSSILYRVFVLCVCADRWACVCINGVKKSIAVECPTGTHVAGRNGQSRLPAGDRMCVSPTPELLKFTCEALIPKRWCLEAGPLRRKEGGDPTNGTGADRRGLTCSLLSREDTTGSRQPVTRKRGLSRIPTRLALGSRPSSL